MRFIVGVSSSYAMCMLANSVSPPTGGSVRQCSTEPFDGRVVYERSECHCWPKAMRRPSTWRAFTISNSAWSGWRSSDW